MTFARRAKMLMQIACTLAAFGCAAIPSSAVAGAADPSHAVDPHIRYVDYDPDDVVHVTGYTGYQIIVEFGPDERIETVGLGDAADWQVTPNGAATVMFLKPVGIGRATNLAVVTNLRRYNFELSSRSGAHAPVGRIVYALRFRYPQDEQAVAAAAVPPAPPPLSPVAPEQWNRAYSFEGARSNVPDEVFDDGKSTYFRFAPGQQKPAIFSITDGSGETVVNSAERDGYTIVDQLAPVFIFRQGTNVTKLYNDGFATPAPGPEAPRERPARKRGLFHKKDKS